MGAIADFKASPLALLWSAGLAIVLVSFFHHGCIHTTCSNGYSNAGVSIRSKTHKGGVRYHGLVDTVESCESACVSLDSKKGTCHSFMYFREGSDMATQCFLNMEEKWMPVKDVRAVTGRRFFLTKYTYAFASHKYAVDAIESLNTLLLSMGKWPFVVGMKTVAAKLTALAAKVNMPALPTVVTAHANIILAVFLLLWPAPFLLASSADVSEKGGVKAVERAGSGSTKSTPISKGSNDPKKEAAGLLSPRAVFNKTFVEPIGALLNNLIPKNDANKVAPALVLF